MIQLSPTALQEIKRLSASRQQPEGFLSLKVRSGGCAGWYYVLDWCAATERECDQLDNSQGIPILIDPESVPYLEHLRIDYAEDLMGGGFRFSNAQADKVCSCGLSFHWPEETYY